MKYEPKAPSATNSKQRPGGLLRFALRVPIWLYRLHLGWLLGQRFLLLTHTGRQSGLPRYTVVEVVDHDTATGAYFIASGWGEQSDWYRNIQKDSRVMVQVSTHRFKAIAVRLPAGEAEHHYAKYAQRHALAFRELSRFMIGEKVDDVAEACRRAATFIPLVALCPNL